MNEEKFKTAIAELNKARETGGVDIGGKLYSMVKDRVEVFRKMFGDEFGIDTDVDYGQGFGQSEVIVGKAKVIDRNGVVLASGHSMERVGSNPVATTAIVEAVETAAIGRALAAFGLHGGEFASDAEMTSIPRKQEASRQQGNGQARQPNREPAVLVRGELYVPNEHDQMWDRPDVETEKVVMSIDQLRDVNEMGKYWSALAGFRKVLEREDNQLLASLKAAFAQKNNELAAG